MRKTAITTLTLFVFLCSLLSAQNANNETYIKAMTTPDPSEKAQLLKDYVTNNRGAQYENFACAELCTFQYPGKTAADTIKYGERAIELGGLDALKKCHVLTMVANQYVTQGQNLPKSPRPTKIPISPRPPHGTNYKGQGHTSRDRP